MAGAFARKEVKALKLQDKAPQKRHGRPNKIPVFLLGIADGLTVANDTGGSMPVTVATRAKLRNHQFL